MPRKSKIQNSRQNWQVSHKHVRRHELPPWIGAPLWWTASRLRQHWKPIAWTASVLVSLYLPNALHVHANAKDIQRCDRINYAALVAYQYGCTGRDCSAELQQYEQIVQLAMASLTQDCYPEAPWTPTRQLASWASSYNEMVSPLKAIVPPEEPVNNSPETLEIASNGG